MTLPHMPFYMKIGDASDDQLHRMKIEHLGFIGVMDRIMSRVKNRSKAIQSELSKREAQSKKAARRGDKKPTIVTDHAIVRYLERKQGLDVDAIVSEIRSNISDGESFMNGTIVMHDGMMYVRRSPGSNDEAVSTIMPEDYLDEDTVEVAQQAMERDAEVQARKKDAAGE